MNNTAAQFSSGLDHLSMTVIYLHAAFAVVFLFFYRQQPTKYSRLIAWSWLTEAIRVLVIQVNTFSGSLHWITLADCLNILGTWWLLEGCADLTGVRLPVKLRRIYIGLSIPLILGLRYLAPIWVHAWWNIPPNVAFYWSEFIELIVIYLPVTLVRGSILFWLVRIWRESRLAGALLGGIFAAPYVVFSLAVPFQHLVGYYSHWTTFFWVVRYVGFALGLLLLLFDRQLAEQRETSAKLRSFLTAAPIGIGVMSNRIIQETNETLCGILSYTREEMISRSDRFLYLSDEHYAASEAEDARHAGQSIWSTEVRLLRKDGTQIDASLTKAPINPASPHEGLVVTVTDVTARKLAEQELAWRTALFEAQVDSSIDGILVVDTHGKKIIQNQRMAAIWEIPPEVAKDPNDARQVTFVISRVKSPEQFAEKIAYLYSRPEEISRDIVELVDGKILDRYSAPVRDQRGTYYGRIWTFRDITEQRRLEEQLRQSQKMEAVGQLSGGIAHDFNNLLTVIIGHLGLLRANREVTPEMADSLAEVSAAANRAAALTRQLLAFSRRQVINVRALGLNETVTNLVKLLQRLLSENIAIQLDLSPAQLTFNGDAGMMEQVLVNLAINARDAMPEGGTLRIVTGYESGTGRPGDHVYLEVSDTGSGIRPDILPRIFEPFFTTKDVGKGTGLGLATVFGIVQQHNGWIEVKSDLGRGTVFRIYLPRLAGVPNPVRSAIPAACAGGRGEVILLVEDEPAIRELGKNALTRQGYRVLLAANGRAAMDLWAAHKAEISLLLTDMIMPDGMTGAQLAQELLRENPALSVIYSSGYNKENTGKEYSLRKHDNYLGKPYELEQLYRIVRTTLDSRQS
ncbi:MAG TPA: ATP-binding protein [Lacunisphaera sp.]|jgi:PAS domain S-box-containing protein